MAMGPREGLVGLYMPGPSHGPDVAATTVHDRDRGVCITLFPYAD